MIKRSGSGESIDLIVDLDDADSQFEDRHDKSPGRVIPAAHVPIRPCQTDSKKPPREPFASIQVAVPVPAPAEESGSKTAFELFLQGWKRLFRGRISRFEMPRLSRWKQLVLAGGAFLAGLLLFLLSNAWIGNRDSDQAPIPLAGDAALERINEAFAQINGGNAAGALDTLRDVEAKFGETPSLDYITALAALQAGDHGLAERRALASIRKGELVSDSLVLQSMAEVSSLPRGSGMRDLKVLREALLRRAVRSNPSNPFPMVELADLLRSQGRLEEAKAVLTAAKHRLHPVDTHAVVEISLLLAELQSKPDSELPPAAEDGPLAEMFASAYINWRKGRADLAAKALEKCRLQSGRNLFDYIMSDPVFSSLQAKNSSGTM